MVEVLLNDNFHNFLSIATVKTRGPLYIGVCLKSTITQLQRNYHSYNLSLYKSAGVILDNHLSKFHVPAMFPGQILSSNLITSYCAEPTISEVSISSPEPRVPTMNVTRIFGCSTSICTEDKSLKHLNESRRKLFHNLFILQNRSIKQLLLQRELQTPRKLAHITTLLNPKVFIPLGRQGIVKVRVQSQAL